MRAVESQDLGQVWNVNVEMFRKSDKYLSYVYYVTSLFYLTISLCYKDNL